jgi:hypothetical protein
LRPTRQSVVIHTSINFAYEDSKNLTNDKLKEIAKSFLNKMGLSENQSIAMKHTDAKHLHFHIITNRIGFDGSVASDSFIKNRAARACDELEVEYGLTVARGHELGAAIKDKNPVKNRVKTLIRESILEGLNNRISDLNSLKEFLKEKDIEMIVQFQKTGRVNGLSFKKDSIAFKGSAIDKNFSFKGIEKKLKERFKNSEHIHYKLSITKENDYER